MSQVVAQSIKITDTVTETLTFGTATGVRAEAKSQRNFDYSTGTAAGQIDYHFERSYTLAAGASTTLVLSAVTDDIPRTFAFVRLKRLSIDITAKTGNDALTVGNAASNPITSLTGGGTQTYTVRRYDLKVADDATGFAVAAGSSDQLKFLNGGSASMTFTVSITGNSA
jgi:phage-related baseplate assembly protein